MTAQPDPNVFWCVLGLDHLDPTLFDLDGQ
jgi:hypothetical protein